MTNGRIRYCGLILRAARAKITVVGIHTALNFCANFYSRPTYIIYNCVDGARKTTCRVTG